MTHQAVAFLRTHLDGLLVFDWCGGRGARGGRERQALGRRRGLQINRDAGGVGRVSAADTVCLHYELMDISGVALMKRPKNDCGGTGEVHRAKFERMMDGWSRVLQNRSVFL